MEKREDAVTKVENSKRLYKEPGVLVEGKLLEEKRRAEGFSWTIPFIHLAGTNGKGSTAAFLASVLKTCGYRVGLFTSPHLVDFTERIQVNGVPVTRERACELAEQAFETARAAETDAGMFDYCTLMAVSYLQEQQCDIAVIETGMGGRLDATNALGVPIVTVITPIGFDHMQQLGGTLKEIAGEKAGIIKPGTHVVLAAQEKEAEQVLVEACQKNEVPYVLAGKAPRQAERSAWKLGLKGEYQKENAATALEVVDTLKQIGWKLPETLVEQGMAEAKWPGRLERVWTEPEIFLDGAHNMHGVRALKKSLQTLYPGKQFHFLMGVLADKDYQEMVEEMIPIAKRIDTVTPESSRALQGEELASLVRRKGLSSYCYENAKEALYGMWHAPKEDTICVFGSLYFIGEIKGLLGDLDEKQQK